MQADITVGLSRGLVAEIDSDSEADQPEEGGSSSRLHLGYGHRWRLPAAGVCTPCKAPGWATAGALTMATAAHAKGGRGVDSFSIVRKGVEVCPLLFARWVRRLATLTSTVDSFAAAATAGSAGSASAAGDDGADGASGHVKMHTLERCGRKDMSGPDDGERHRPPPVI